MQSFLITRRKCDVMVKWLCSVAVYHSKRQPDRAKLTYSGRIFVRGKKPFLSSFLKVNELIASCIFSPYTLSHRRPKSKLRYLEDKIIRQRHDNSGSKETRTLPTTLVSSRCHGFAE
jgi:hypothetical protein